MRRQRGRRGPEPAGRLTPDRRSLGPEPSQPTRYRVRVKGHLDGRWADPCEGTSVTRETGGDTVLTVAVADQAALHALLRRLRDLGVPLVSINPAAPARTADSSRRENR